MFVVKLCFSLLFFINSFFLYALELPKHSSNINPKYTADLISITTENYKTKAKRPKYTALSNQKICTYFDINIQNWEYYLECFLDNFID